MLCFVMGCIVIESKELSVEVFRFILLISSLRVLVQMCSCSYDIIPSKCYVWHAGLGDKI